MKASPHRILVLRAETNAFNRFKLECVLNIYHAGIDLALLRNTLDLDCHSL